MNPYNIVIGQIESGKEKWESISTEIKQKIGNSEQIFQQIVLNFSYDKQLTYEESPVRHFQDPKNYYNNLIENHRQKLRPFPYGLWQNIAKDLHILPFTYYREMLVDIMKKEKSYDILPNFTAVDIYNLVGIGRNQYIEIMNKVRAKKWMWKLNRNIVRELLPKEPLSIEIQFWWIAHFIPLPQGELHKLFSSLTDDEKFALGTLERQGHMFCYEVQHNELLSLFKKGLIFFEIPVETFDYFVIPPEAGSVFIMNRSPDDQFERLVYVVLISLTDGTSAQDLSNILEMDKVSVRNALSFCCRVGFTKKKVFNQSFLQKQALLKEKAIDSDLSVNNQASLIKVPSSGSITEDSAAETGSNEETSTKTQILLDLEENEAPKPEIEVQKQPILENNPPTEPPKPENEVQNQQILEKKASSASIPVEKVKKIFRPSYHHSWEKKISKYHESVAKNVAPGSETSYIPQKSKRIGFLFDSSLTAHLMMGNLAAGLMKSHAVILFEIGKMSDDLIHHLILALDHVKTPEINLSGFDSETGGSSIFGDGNEVNEALQYYKNAIHLRKVLRIFKESIFTFFENKNPDNLLPENTKMAQFLKENENAVDLIQCESLENLNPDQKLRFLKNNYSILIATTPLQPNVLSLPTVLDGFYGAPQEAFNSPWFKLFLYSKVGQGPTSFFFSKGTRLKTLPKQLRENENDTVIISGWEFQDSYPRVSSANVLQQLNESLITQPCLVQIWKKTPTTKAEFFDIPFPFEFSCEITEKGETSLNKTKEKGSWSEERKEGEQKDVEEFENAERIVQNRKKMLFDRFSVAEIEKIKGVYDKIIEKLQLSLSFGLIRMMRVSETQTESNNVSEILPFEVYFGLSLSKFECTEQMLHFVQKKELFSNVENVEKHSQNMKLLTGEFLNFIKSTNESGAEGLGIDAEAEVSISSGNCVLVNPKEKRKNDDAFLPTLNLFYPGSGNDLKNVE